jgi:tRNA1(Val) A37 N6-methylase TrmN6
VSGIAGLGIDLDPGLCGLASANAAANGFRDLMFAAGDLARSPIGGRFDHAFANPPYHPADGTPSPSTRREMAKRGSQTLLPVWVEALSRPLRYRGTLTFILPPWLLPSALDAMNGANVPAETVFPIWPKAGRPARLIIVQGRKQGRARMSLTPGLILHLASGSFSPEADAVLRGGTALRLIAP